MQSNKILVALGAGLALTWVGQVVGRAIHSTDKPS